MRYFKAVAKSKFLRRMMQIFDLYFLK